MDDVITWHYGIVFLPLWVWNTVLVMAVSLGIGCWVKKKNARYGKEQKRHFGAMLQTFFLHLPLFLTEILVVVNTEAGGSLSWTAVFTPMYVLSLLSIAACIISCCIKHCNVEFEILSIASFLQLLFIGLRLDSITSWNWAVVLIPTWIGLVLLVIGLVVYAVFRCCLIVTEEDQEVVRLQRPLTALLLVCLSLIIVCVILFLALLSARLDKLISMSYSALFVPLHISLLLLLVTTITRDSANPWWLGIGRSFTEFILDTVPIVREYANISHRHGYSDNEDEVHLREVDPTVSHYDNLLTVEEPVRSRGRTRVFGGSSKRAAVKNEYIASHVYPYENLYEPD